MNFNRKHRSKKLNEYFIMYLIIDAETFRQAQDVASLRAPLCSALDSLLVHQGVIGSIVRSNDFTRYWAG